MTDDSTPPEKSDSEFSAGDPVHYWIGSDSYGGEVIRVTKARVYVKSGREDLVFTRRDDGLFRRATWSHGVLRHGFYQHYDRGF